MRTVNLVLWYLIVEVFHNFNLISIYFTTRFRYDEIKPNKGSEEMARKFKHLTYTERLIIEKKFNKGETYRAIAEALERGVATIYTEIQRGLYDHLDGDTYITSRKYSAQIAQEDAEQKATAKGMDIKLGNNHEYAQYVSEQIKLGYSPDAIVGRLRREGKWTVNTNTLYSYIEKGYIPDVTVKDLHRQGRQRKRKGKVAVAKRAPKGNSIENRPDDVDDRAVFGHWEMDTVHGTTKRRGFSLLVLTERKTRFEIVYPLKDRKAKSVVTALDRIFPRFPRGIFQTITVDNGSEFMDVGGIEYDRQGKKRTTVYYCHPYTSAERGSNENANKLVRRFFPKGQHMKNVTLKQAKHAMAFMNNMPRKILQYATAQELFNQEVQAA